MRDIADLSEVTEKTLFNNFGSKDRLVAEATAEKSADVIAAAHAAEMGGPWRTLLAIAKAIAEAVLERPELARSSVPLLIDPASGVRIDDVYHRYVAPEVAELVNKGDLVSGSPRDGLVTLIRLGMITGILGWCANDVPDNRLSDHLQWQLAVVLLPFARRAFAEECRAQAARWTLD